MAEARFNVEMYEGIEQDARSEVVASVDYFIRGLPGYRKEMSANPAKGQETIDAIWKKLIAAMDKYGIAHPPEAKIGAERMKPPKK